MTLRELKDDYCDFLLSNTDPSVANVLRRVIISHVPTIAVRLPTCTSVKRVLITCRGDVVTKWSGQGARHLRVAFACEAGRSFVEVTCMAGAARYFEMPCALW